MTAQLLLATRNADKLAELRRILQPEVPEAEVLGLGDVAAYDEPPETEASFEGNALVKARAGAHATGLPTLADDSGLCVDALNGMPGVLSARWSGRPKDDRRNVMLLLDQLADVPPERRGASFVAVVALVQADGTEHVAEGTMPGSVTEAPRGDGGFGYDPIFLPAGQGVTAAEQSAADKDAISHRGRALRAILPTLVQVLSP